MKLIKLELYDDFRSLKSGFCVKFLNELDDAYDKNSFNSYCIVGRNGSGKSNILEVLSAIFYQLEIDYLDFLPKNRVENDEGEIEYEEIEFFLTQKRSPNSYKLEYYKKPSSLVLNSQHAGFNSEYKKVIIIKEKDQKANIYIDDDFENVLSAVEAKVFLPDFIVGYSSGENEILSLPFLKMKMVQYDEFAYYLSEDILYNSPESRMVYLDDTFSQAIFITNFLFPDEKVHQIFKDTIGIKNIKEFRIVINTDKTTTGLYDENFPLFKGVASRLDDLKSCATLYHDNERKNQLVLDFYVDDSCREAFKKFFGQRLELFKFLQVLTILNYHHIDEDSRAKLYRSKSPYAKGFIPQASWDDRFFTFKHFRIEKEGVDELLLSRSLSDGEHQFMHTIGIALLYRGTSSLFLLDEPETHFNPAWRAKYISTLRECFEGNDVSPEVLITSHSPFIVSDSKTDNVLVFEKDVNGVVT